MTPIDPNAIGPQEPKAPLNPNSPSPSHPEREKEVCPDCGGRGGWTTIGQHPLGDCSSCGGTGSVENAPASPTLGAGGSESSEQTRWWYKDQLWVKDGDRTTMAAGKGDTLLVHGEPYFFKDGSGFGPGGLLPLLRPAKSFMCDDGVERWETGEVAHVERKGTWFLDTDGYPVKCETPTIFEHPILEPLPEAILPSPVEEGATIQRYEVDGFGDVLPNQRLGKYVKFTDHARLLSEKDAEIEEVKAQLRLIRAARNRALKGREEATDRANERWTSKIEALMERFNGVGHTELRHELSLLLPPPVALPEKGKGGLEARIEALAASYEEHGHWMNDRNRQITRTTGNALDPDGGREYLQIAKNIRAALSKEES